jgi:hypothetical protein
LRDDGSGKTTVDYVRTFRKEEALRKTTAAQSLK